MHLKRSTLRFIALSVLVAGLLLALSPADVNLAAPSQDVTVVLWGTNSTGGALDGYDYPGRTTLARAVFLPESLYPREAVITDVDVSVTIEKIDGGTNDQEAYMCGSVGGEGHQGGQTYPEEISLMLRGPEGQTVTLVEDDLNSGGTGASSYEKDAYGGIVTLVFNDEAFVYPNPLANITSGTFKPAEPLIPFNGGNPFGNWTLVMGDSKEQDPLCFYSFTVILTLEIPENLMQRRGVCVLTGIDDMIYLGMDNPFEATGKGLLSALRFDYLGGGVAGWLYPSEVFKNGQLWTANFVNANADGTAAIEPGAYRVYCFGPAGTAGNGLKVEVTK